MNNSTVDSKYGLQDVNYSSNLLNSAAESLLVVSCPKGLMNHSMIQYDPVHEISQNQSLLVANTQEAS